MTPSIIQGKHRRENNSSDEVIVFPAELDLQQQLLTPPQSPVLKRRVRIQGLSEESEAPLVPILDKIRNEDFRAGGPILCRIPTVSVPVTTGPAFDAWSAGPLAASIRTILNKWSVGVYNVSLVERSFKFDDSMPTHPTIFVYNTVKQKPTNNWLKACLEIRACCNKYGFPDMNVEIADARGLETILSSSVESHHTIAPLWPKLRIEIVKVLGKRDWIALSLLRRGKESLPHPHPVTVVVTVDLDSEDGDWEHISRQIAGLLDAVNLTSVMVEIGRGKLWKSAEHEPLPADSWTETVKFGGSMKARDPLVGSGTLGGIIRLHSPKDGTFRDYGLTCFHCVVSEQSTNVWGQKGLYPNDPKNGILLDMPSPLDHATALTKFNEDIQYLDSDAIKQIGLQLEDPEAAECIAKSDKRRYVNAIKSIDMIKTKVKNAEAFMATNKMLLGKVLAGSGFRVAPQKECCLDWALVDFRNGRTGSNTLPTKADVPRAIRDIYNPIDPLMASIKHVQAGEIVLKVGRATGTTFGNFQKMLQTDTLHSWTQKETGEWEEVTTLECAVLTPYGSEPFGRAGDSGSFVFSTEGEMIGLYFGGNDHTGLSYFTRIQDVFDDIKKITQAKEVTLPEL